MKPLGYRILLKPEDLGEKTEGGILIPDTVRDKERLASQVGIVVSIGDECWSETGKPWAKVGDRVLFSKYSQKRIVDPDTEEEYIVLNDQDLICSLEEK